MRVGGSWECKMFFALYCQGTGINYAMGDIFLLNRRLIIAVLGARSWQGKQLSAFSGLFPWACFTCFACPSSHTPACLSELPAAGFQSLQLPGLGKHIFTKQKCRVFYMSKSQLTNIQWWYWAARVRDCHKIHSRHHSPAASSLSSVAMG